MNLQLASLIVIALAVLLGVIRGLRTAGKWRLLMVLGQVLMGGALALLLYPPSIPQDRETAVVLTAGVTASQLAGIDPQATQIALPEAAAGFDHAERVADLGSAIRKHPEIGKLRILGDGLPARDRDATANLGIAFEPGEESRGLVELQIPDAVSAGTLWSLSGRIAGITDARVELLDRNETVVGSATSESDGSFRLSTVARANSRMLYRLRVLDASDALIEDVPVAVAARPGDGLRTLVVAGAPDPELKYLRRWIVDAGHSLRSQISLSRGIEQRQSAPDLDPATLAETDLLIVDERSWAGLSQSAKAAVRSAVESGMGLLLRATGPVPKAVVEDWKAIGFALEHADIARSVSLADAFAEIGGSRTFTRAPLKVLAPGSVSLLKAADETDLARWRAAGQGRIGVWLPLDTYRMALDGYRKEYGTLWSQVFSTLARARADASPVLPDHARIHQRSVICGLESGAEIEDAKGIVRKLLVEQGRESCAAWWPDEAGWHVLINADGHWPIHVLGEGEGRSLQRMESREATLALVTDAQTEQRASTKLPRWPFFLIWLAVAGLFWWLERRRLMI